MNTTTILQRIRQAAYIGDAAAFPEYTDAKLLQEASDRLRTIFSETVQRSRSGYALKTQLVTTTTQTVRVPDRSLNAGIHSIELKRPNNGWAPLQEVLPEDQYLFDSKPPTATPTRFTLEGGDIRLLPPLSQSVDLRIRYYLRPSTLQTAQTAGLVASVTGTQVTVNVLPVNQVTLATIATGDAVDSIRPQGWCEPTTISEIVSVSGTTLTYPTPVEGIIRSGDYIRAADQTDWPMVPEEYHRLLADLTAIVVLREMGIEDKAGIAASQASRDLERFTDSLAPRVQTQPRKIRIRW